ncbi:MAG: hypothetical protein JW816_01250, partial [Candidatus Buchananbacteria bacterium]|nr:hypothetical protein [Candidatus Buchananbacteria bacterium]
TNFTIEMISFLKNQECPFGCSVGIVNPIYTPCFYGAICFTIAFILIAVILAQTKKIEVK